MRKALLFVLIFTFSLNLLAQNNPPPRSPLDPVSWGVVYDVPATKTVSVKTNLVFMRSGERNLAIDIYTPPTAKTG